MTCLLTFLQLVLPAHVTMEDVVRRRVFRSLHWYLASSRISVLVDLILDGCLVSILALGIAFGIYVGLKGAFLERFVFLLRQLDGSLILEALPLLLADAVHLVQLLPPRLLTLDLLGLLELWPFSLFYNL